jgi:hypothetical protein
MNTERKLATLRTIRVIDPIPGADRIETARVDGWAGNPEETPTSVESALRLAEGKSALQECVADMESEGK